MSEVWYASYGSNMAAERFACYLYGGKPPGGARHHPGCRDRTPPAATRAVTLPGVVYFAGESGVWTGGVAYLDPTCSRTSPARAYLITREQFADVAAQESGREPGLRLDFSELLGNGRLALGLGSYETLLCAGSVDGHPVLTFTAAERLADVVPTAPSEAYLRTVATGLLESHDWRPERVARYLSGLPGADVSWSSEAILELLGERVS